MDTVHHNNGVAPPDRAGSAPSAASRSGRARLAAAVALIIVTLGATLGLTSGTASAASFSTPALYCYDGSVKVDPGVRSWYGTSDGYYRITLYKYTSVGWRAIRSAQGRTSYNQVAVPGNIGFANVGSGFFAAGVERWNAQNGRWVQLSTVAAQRVDPYFQRPTGVTVCQLY